MQKYFYLSLIFFLFMHSCKSTKEGRKTQKQTSIAGKWVGALEVAGQKLPLIIEIQPKGDDSWTAEMQSPSQSKEKLQADEFLKENTVIAINYHKIAASFEGNWDAKEGRITGTWQQAGISMPLVLRKEGGDAADLNQVENVLGDWEGTLSSDGVALLVVFHIEGDAQQLRATMDSPNQGVRDIPVEKISYTDGVLRIEVPKIMGVFEGNWQADPKKVEGTWTQNGQSLPLILKPQDDSPTQYEASGEWEEIAGIWQGAIENGGVELTLAFHVWEERGKLEGEMDSPDQGVTGLVMSDVSYADKQARFEIATIAAAFEGNMEGDKLVGEWIQQGMKLPLTLEKVDQAIERKRPQEPRPPFAYKTEDLTFSNETADIRLAGTFTRPQAGGPFPCLILISGSGPQDRNEEILRHKPFWVIADYLTQRGYAVLRYDDRGFGDSSGDFSTATSEDFASDVEAAIAYLKSRPSEVDTSKIVLVGHSEGGLIAQLVAAQNPSIAGIISLAGPGIPCHELMLEQQRIIAEKSGMPKEGAKLVNDLFRPAYEVLRSDVSNEEAMTKVEEWNKKFWQEISNSEQTLLQQNQITKQTLSDAAEGLKSPWFRYFLAYEPADYLSNIHCPVLALNGAKDVQVLPKSNLDGIRKGLKAAKNPNVDARELTDLNHLFQTCETGLPGEYGKIEETFSPDALKLMVNWLELHIR